MTTNQPPNPGSRIDNAIQISDLTRVLKKYGLYLLGGMVLTATLAIIWGKFQPNLYDSVALVHLTQHNSLSLGGMSEASDDYSIKIMTQVIGMQSPSVAEETMRRLKLPANPNFNDSPTMQNLDDPVQRDKLVKKFLSALSVEQKPKTELLEVRFRSKSPVLAMLVVNTLVDVYFEQSFQQRYKSTELVSNFLRKNLEDLRSKIQSEQSDLLNDESKLGIHTTGPNSEENLLESELMGVLQEGVRAQTTLYLAEANYDNMVKHPEAAYPNETPGAPALNQLTGLLIQSKAQEAALESKYGPNYPLLQQQKAQTATLQKSVDEARQEALNAAAQAVQAARKESESISDHLTSLQATAKGRTPETVQFEILKAQYTGDQTLYNVLLAAVGTGAIQAGLQGQDLNRFTEGEIPGMKSYPVMAVIALAGAGIGLVLGLMVISVIMLNSDTVETIEQIEQALPIPILASVPEYKDEMAAMRISEDSLPLVTLLAPRSAGTEAYRLLRTAISLMPISQKHRVISLTSGGPGEGKSTTTMNLAVVLATQSKRVLLIDADLRKPTIAQRLKLPPSDQPGLSRYLSDTTITPEECLQTVPEVAGLDVFPVQEIPPFPSELLGQGRLEQLLLWARDHYDYVLIDTPPVLLVTDALIIASHCDTLLLVVRVGVAQRRALRRIRQDLSKYPGKQTGIVVNALPIQDTYYGGYGNYRKYYGGKGYGGYGYGEKGTYYGAETGGGYIAAPKKK